MENKKVLLASVLMLVICFSCTLIDFALAQEPSDWLKEQAKKTNERVDLMYGPDAYGGSHHTAKVKSENDFEEERKDEMERNLEEKEKTRHLNEKNGVATYDRHGNKITEPEEYGEKYDKAYADGYREAFEEGWLSGYYADKFSKEYQESVSQGVEDSDSEEVEEQITISLSTLKKIIIGVVAIIIILYLCFSKKLSKYI